MDSQKLIIKDQIIEKTQYYKKKPVYERQKTDKIVYLSYDYNMRKIHELKLQKHLQFNIKIFKTCSEIQKGCNLNIIRRQMNENNETKTVITNHYQCRLNEYIQKNRIDESEALEIIRQIIEAVYCVVKSQYYCFNIRAQNFVGLPQKGTKKYRWKLESVPFVLIEENIKSRINGSIQKNNEIYKEIKSPMVFKSEYQPPEAYKNHQNRNLNKSDLQESLVWNIGCIWLHLLYGKHFLYSYQMIKKFCLGNGTDGIHSVGVLGIEKDKLTTPESKSLMQSMLQFESFRRMQLKTLFSNVTLAGKIKKFQELYFENITSKIYNDPSNFLQFEHKYDSFNDLLAILVKKSNEANLDYKFQEKNIIKQILNADSNIFKKKELKTKIISTNQQANINPNNIQNSQKTFTYDQIKQYFKPYKFYYDKAIFLADCTEEISRKLLEILQKKKFIITMLSPSTDGKKEDLLFTFQFVMNFMRLIYLQTLLQNLKLYRNIFNIPKCTYNIGNSEFENTSEQWQLFNDTALYHAFSIYVEHQYKSSENQLIKLLQKNNNNQFISSSCKNKIQYFSTLNYKVCTTYRFLPYYQKVLKDVLETIDEFSICRPDFKRPSQQDVGEIGTNMKNIGLLLVAYFIQNQKVFSQQNYNLLFGRFMIYPIPNQPQFIKSGYLKIKFSRQDNNLQAFQLGEKGDQIFNFEKYQKFLVEGDSTKVSEHVSYLLKRLKY